MATRYAHVDLELRLATEPISGMFRADGEHSHPFTGWLELAALLDRARQTTHAALEDPLPFEGSTA
jgi:hypothetical protein